jgi:hypothetical protein
MIKQLPNVKTKNEQTPWLLKKDVFWDFVPEDVFHLYRCENIPEECSSTLYLWLLVCKKTILSGRRCSAKLVLAIVGRGE